MSEVFGTEGTRHSKSTNLFSAACYQLAVPHVRCTITGTYAFSSAGPTVWNLLTDYLTNEPPLPLPKLIMCVNSQRFLVKPKF